MKELQVEMFPRVDPAIEYWKKLNAARPTASKLQHLVWSTLKRHPEGLTNHELVEKTGIEWNTITPRVAPLVRKNLVRDSGMRRKGPSGKACIVWQAV